MEVPLDGWSIGRADDVEWTSWGSRGDAKAKVLGSADGFFVLVKAVTPRRRVRPTSISAPSRVSPTCQSSRSDASGTRPG
jgi:hypothetical protein